MTQYFEELTDPREAWEVQYPLHEVVIMTISAVVAECEAWNQIEHYCKTKAEWFKAELGLELKNGVP